MEVTICSRCGTDRHPTALHPPTGNPWPRMTALARKFPCFGVGGSRYDTPGIDPWDAEAFALYRQGASSGERYAMDFLLWVFNRYDYEFDFAGAAVAWSYEYREPVSLWLRDPWWA